MCKLLLFLSDLPGLNLILFFVLKAYFVCTSCIRDVSSPRIPRQQQLLLILQSGTGTPLWLHFLLFLQTLPATHCLLDTAVPHVVSSQAEPRSATRRLFHHVDVNLDKLFFHVFMRAVVPGPCFLRAFKGSTWNGDGVDLMLSTHPSGCCAHSNITYVLLATRLARCACCPLKCGCVLPSSFQEPVA